MTAGNTKKKQWTIFLCYSPTDIDFVDWLYRKLKSTGLTVWYDKHEIITGESIPRMKAKGIEGSEYFIIIISQEALQSKWVEEELMATIYTRIAEQQGNILPLILEGTEIEKLPLFLKDKKRIQFPKSGSDDSFQELIKDIDKLRESSNSETFLELKNPFRQRGAIDPKLFVVTEILSQITKDIMAKRSVLVVGPSMIGKSSLLKFLASPVYKIYYYEESSSNSEPIFTYFNLQEHVHKSYNDLILEIANAMSISHKVKKKSRKHTIDNIYEEALEQIKNIVGKKQPGFPPSVLLLDAFDRINDFKDISATLFDNFCVLAEDYNVCFIIASRVNLHDLSLPQGIGTSKFINLLEKYSLKVWDSLAVRSLMFELHGKPLNVFNDSDLVYMTNLTARHPFLLQIGCFHLFEALKSGQEDNQDQLLEKYLDDTESFYRFYLEYEINKPERKWLIDCWRALSQKGKNAQDTLQKLSLGQKNRNIRNKLKGLGLVLDKPEAIEIPKGLEAFLERTQNK